MKLTNEICISFLRGSGWLYNHDKEITISEHNKAIDDFVNLAKEHDFKHDKKDITNCVIGFIEFFAEQLKEGGENEYKM